MDQKPARKIFSVSVEELESIRNFLSYAASSAGLDKSKVYKLCLAADEIATNIILHGYIKSGIKEGNVDISLHVEKNNVITIISDSAAPFNPLKRKLPTDHDLEMPLEDRQIGGLGILMAIESVDEYDYKYEDGKNYNILKIKLQ